MTTITLDRESVTWLRKNIKGGIRRKNRTRRKLLLKQLNETTLSSTKSNQPRISPPKKNHLFAGTCGFKVLEVFEMFPDGLAASEAAELSGHPNPQSAQSSVSDHKRRGFVRVVGVNGNRNILAITQKGKTALNLARREAK